MCFSPELRYAKAIMPEYKENLHQVDANIPADTEITLDFVLQRSKGDRNGRFNIGAQLAQMNTPALFGANLIDQVSDQTLIAIMRKQQLLAGGASAKTEDAPVGRSLILADGRLGKFGWKGQTAGLLDFVQAACANELGLSNPNHKRPAPISRQDLKQAAYDLTQEQCKQMADFVASLPRPIEEVPADDAGKDQIHRGKGLFNSVGCAACHVPTVGSVQGIYSDLLLHRMGPDLDSGGSQSYGFVPNGSPESTPLSDEWRTPPLWGVADSGPYLHDGRAKTLEEAIRLHGGQAKASSGNFAALPRDQQVDLVRFLKSLKAPG